MQNACRERASTVPQYDLPIRLHFRRIRISQKPPTNTRWGLLKCYWVYKPGSVLTAIYLDLKLLSGSSRLLEAVGPTCMLLHGVASDRVYSTPLFPRSGWSLTPPFHPYCASAQRYLSVALVLRSPSAGVTRYPCPMKPGLSSPGAFQHPAAAVRPSCVCILPHFIWNVKHLAKCF